MFSWLFGKQKLETAPAAEEEKLLLCCTVLMTPEQYASAELDVFRFLERARGYPHEADSLLGFVFQAIDRARGIGKHVVSEFPLYNQDSITPREAWHLSMTGKGFSNAHQNALELEVHKWLTANGHRFPETAKECLNLVSTLLRKTTPCP